MQRKKGLFVRFVLPLLKNAPISHVFFFFFFFFTTSVTASERFHDKIAHHIIIKIILKNESKQFLFVLLQQLLKHFFFCKFLLSASMEERNCNRGKTVGCAGTSVLHYMRTKKKRREEPGTLCRSEISTAKQEFWFLKRSSVGGWSHVVPGEPARDLWPANQIALSKGSQRSDWHNSRQRRSPPILCDLSLLSGSH